MLPQFNEDGNLPEGVHQAAEADVLARFASSSARRKWLGGKLQVLLAAARATGELRRVFLWGSFVTAKDSPNDLDVLLVMDTDFHSESVPSDLRVVFDHTEAKIRFNADVFWTNSSLDPVAFGLWLDVYQTARDFKRRGIVEVLIT
jgi:hypothetical protein